MKNLTLIFLGICSAFSTTFAQKGQPQKNTVPAHRHYYIDMHQLEPGKVSFEDVAAAHLKDLETQKKYDANFLRFWVDEEAGMVYCLSSAPDSQAVKHTHAEAHGLIPAHVYEVTEGQAAAMQPGKDLFLDIHYLGAGNVTAKDVAEAHVKDLATQDNYDVNFINYWVNEKEGVVFCLSQAKSSEDVIKTHTQAHGLIPFNVLAVREGK